MIPNNVTNPMVEISELLARTTRNIKFDNVNFFQKIFGRELRPSARPTAGPSAGRLPTKNYNIFVSRQERNYIHDTSTPTFQKKRLFKLINHRIKLKTCVALSQN